MKRNFESRLNRIEQAMKQVAENIKNDSERMAALWRDEEC